MKLSNDSWEAFITIAAKSLAVALSLGIAVFAVGLLMGYPIKWCWNYVMPHISNGALPEIGFWHALCLGMLAGLLIKPTS